MALFIGIHHFGFVFGVDCVVSLVVGSNFGHVEGIVLQKLVVIEDTLGPAGAGHYLVHCHIYHGLLIGRRQPEVGLQGALLRHIVVTIRMLAAVVDVLLVDTLNVLAVYPNGEQWILRIYIDTKLKNLSTLEFIAHHIVQQNHKDHEARAQHDYRIPDVGPSFYMSSGSPLMDSTNVVWLHSALI